jgi:hypothetical protein
VAFEADYLKKSREAVMIRGMSVPHALTKKQKRLMKELGDLYALLNLDFYDIKYYAPHLRTTFLELMRRAAARQLVVTAYTHVDEYLSCELCVYFFGSKRPFPLLWKTKKFKLFNSNFLEEMSMLPKFRYVKALKTIPKDIAADIDRLNALRNAMAHSFFPENVKKSRALWKGESIFSQRGIEHFYADFREMRRFFESIRKGRY